MSSATSCGFSIFNLTGYGEASFVSSSSVQAAAAPPATFTANPNIGPGGNTFVDSPHFRVYGAAGSPATTALNFLEASYSCYVDDLGWRSSGLSYKDTTDSDGPWTKVNVYSVGTLNGAAGVMHGDYNTGMAWLEVVDSYLTNPGVTVHEFGHGLTYHAKTWVDQGLTGAWWETVAEWFADTYKTSSLCAPARARYNQQTSPTNIALEKIISDAHQVLVDGTPGSGNYYQAWPFLSYLTYNPDRYPGLGANVVREGFAQYARGSNETPLHVYARLSTGTSIQAVVGRYWARMAFADIGHPTAASVFAGVRGRLNYANLDAQGGNVYRVKGARQPRYMGASIVPLSKAGAVVVGASVSGASGAYTATLSIRNTFTGATRYVDFLNGAVSASLANEEEAMVVVANTPGLIQYDPFSLSAEASRGLDYTLTLSGVTA